MWGTVILDAYGHGEQQKVADALDDLCDPHSSYGFASGGIYCYWNFSTRDVLYVGRARDLADRFKQHNGLKGTSARGNKREEIKAYFSKNELLGYSILVRDPAAQGIVASSLRGIGDPLLREVLREGSRTGDLEINDAEGIAIRSELLAQGALPAWNRIAGSDPIWRPRLTRHDDSGSLFTGGSTCCCKRGEHCVSCQQMRPLRRLRSVAHRTRGRRPRHHPEERSDQPRTSWSHSTE